MNLSDLRAYVQQQKIIIAAYERYYKDANSVIENANTEIKEVNKDVEKLNEPKEKKSLFDKLSFGRDEWLIIIYKNPMLVKKTINYL